VARGRSTRATEGSVPNLINGISQQSPATRLPSQAEASDNYYATLVEGLTKRPRTDHLAPLANLPAGTFTHFILRDETEKYVCAILLNGTIRVWDFAGVEKMVNNTSTTYLAGLTNPSRELRALTLLDHTFIVNKTKVVTQATTTEPTRPFEALINVAAGNYAKDYKIIVNGILASSYRPPNGGDSSHAKWIDTVHIAGQLYVGLNEARSGNADADSYWFGIGGFNVAPWAIGRYNSTLYIRNTTTDFAISTEDGFNGRAMKGIKKTVQKFSDLPLFGPDGVVIEVQGTDTTQFDNYWVKFVKAADTDESGVWKECVKPGSKLGFNALTMPHQLVRESNGTFTFKAVDWEERKCGDLESVPDPSFVGTNIEDLFHHKNRLGFLTKDNVVLSASGQFYNFYRSTLTALLDTDPIDTAASSIKASKLRHAVLFQRELLAFADTAQFVVKGNELLTPKTVNADALTEISASERVRPVVAASSIYFVSEGDQWAKLYEYYIDKALETADYDEASAHAPTYIPAGVNRLCASPDHDIVLITTDGDPSAIYTYKFFFQGEEKLQAAWSRWTLPGAAAIVDMAFDKGKVRLLVRRGTTVYLESFTVEQSVKDPGVGYVVYLDRSVVIPSGTYNAGTGLTTFTLPYAAPTGLVAVTVPGGALPDGFELPVTTNGTASVTVGGDFRTQPLRFGIQFRSAHVLSPFYQRSADGRTTNEDGRLQILGLALIFTQAAYFRVGVKCEGRENRIYTFNGNVLGDGSSQTGVLSLKDGRFSLPVMSRNDRVTITIVNDTWLPSAFTSAKWHGTFNAASRHQ
jgi:hypothetical protein